MKYKHCHRMTDEPVKRGTLSPDRPVPEDIPRPPYIANGGNPPTRNERLVKSANTINAMRKAGLAAGEGLAHSVGVTGLVLDNENVFRHVRRRPI